MNPASLPPIPFSRPDIGDEEIAEVVATLRSGWLTSGPRVKEFEARFAAMLGEGVTALAVNSATAGLHLALEALGLGPGDEVITSTLTFTATAEVVRYLGAEPVFVDVDPVTLNLAPAAVEAAITPRTRMIMPVHYAGLPCDMDALAAIAARHGLRIVEDAAHALPARHRGRLVGTLDSDATVFSFYANKTMTTGEGGMLVTRDPAIARRAAVMRLHGIDRDAYDRFRTPGAAWYYEVVAPGFKYNLTDLAASVGLHQLAKVEAFRAGRERLARRYAELLAGLPLTLPADADPSAGGLHSWHLYPVRLHAGARLTRDALFAALAERGIGCSVHYVPLHRQPYWRDRYGLRAEDFPVAEAAYQGLLSLPLYHLMRDDEQDRVAAALRTLLG
ncbi:DegT/DnrJ/EryC1/StrS family aminotransferase [Chitinimonas koreensis]|uniref:DegT/DnrJ/EryC1/StrS family aminotransferase n=1 Tax=Chitinimonas koreensis TaxID=356302 RepID=UPI00040AFF77|nr:DegT/DnrJ/EryC1/StrS family aminotransferase [Chitinimonas koreensis]QNM97362.1 DegT/DnrJ/EryC1/StrS family aminotransferase [Chitinimonas koreensis]